MRWAIENPGPGIQGDKCRLRLRCQNILRRPLLGRSLSYMSLSNFIASGGVVGRLITDRMGVLESELYELVVISIRQASKVIKSWLLDQRLQLQQ